MAVGVVLVHNVDLQLAKSAAESDLARRRQLLRREDEHLIAQERLIEGAENRLRSLARHIEA